jgi:hypothetical protein
MINMKIQLHIIIYNTVKKKKKVKLSLYRAMEAHRVVKR